MTHGEIKGFNMWRNMEGWSDLMILKVSGKYVMLAYVAKGHGVSK